MTQAELGAHLNYSDKTISKWERAEAIPDSYVLKQLSVLFGVTVDDLLTAHGEGELTPTRTDEDAPYYSTNVIIALAVVGVLTATLLAFVLMWILGNPELRILLGGVSLALLTGAVLGLVFRKARIKYVVAAFVLSLFLLLFFLLPGYTPWQLFLVAVPAEILVFLAFSVKRRGARRGKKS